LHVLELNYINFFVTRDQILKKNNDYFSINDTRLINIVSLAFFQETRLSVVDLMKLKELGSPQTIHNRIKELVSTNWIELQTTDDNRRYQVSPSKKLLNYFDTLGKVISSNL
jgi:hypothetical protein